LVKYLWLLLVCFSVIFANNQPVPYELIKNKLPELVAQPPADFDACVQSLNKGDMVLGVPLHDSLQIYGDCQNVQIGNILVNQAGYLSNGPKVFYYIGAATSFEIINAQGVVVSQGSFGSSIGTVPQRIYGARASNNASAETGGDTRYTITDSVAGSGGAILTGVLPDGLPEDEPLQVKVGSAVSATFIISPKVYSMVKDAVLKYFGIARSGDSESWFHGPSHTKDIVPGGWYDCGDHLKEGLTQSYAAAILGALAAVHSERDTDHFGYNHNNTINTDGVGDLLREAKHGVDYIITSYDLANGVVANMITSVGVYGSGGDHSYWGRPEMGDNLPERLGGPANRNATPRNEVWSTVTGRFAAAAAFVSRLYREYDAAYADKALQVAKDLYEHGKQLQDFGGSSAYSGEQTFDDDMALAAVALAWATKEKYYFDDLVRNTSLGTKNMADGSMFLAGWLAAGSSDTFTHGKANLSWANIHPVALWAMGRLLILPGDLWDAFELNFEEASHLAASIGMGLAFNLDVVDAIGNGGTGAQISLPVPSNPYAGNFTNSDGYATFDPVWHERSVDQNWIYNRYQFGNIATAYMYWDIANRLNTNGIAPYKLSANAGIVATANRPLSDWNVNEVYSLLINQMDYMLGRNPWDMSMIQGVGDKNSMHVHHRGANPEGRNTPGGFYFYSIPTGALTGGQSPKNASWFEHYDDFELTELCLDAATVTIIPTVGLSDDEDLKGGPKVSVIIEYIGYDKAMITVKQDKFGPAFLNLGTAEGALNERIDSPSPGVEHSFLLENLTPATNYYFTATGQNNRGLAQTTRYLVDSSQTPYAFTTLSSPPSAASIQNVKVCNVTSDSAQIMWYTPNGEYGHKVLWDVKPSTAQSMAFSHTDLNPPSKFHIVDIGNLKEKTTYNFVVESDGEQESYDDNGVPLEFTTPVEHVAFDVRAHTYDWNGSDDALSLVIVNQDSKEYDSLEARMYMRAPEYVTVNGNSVLFSDHFAWRMDIGIQYQEAGYQGEHFKGVLDPIIGAARPKLMPDTYDAGTNTYVFYIPIPLGPVVMNSGSRFRLDLLMDTRSPWPPYKDLMNQVPIMRPTRLANGNYHPLEWSFGPKSIANGDPVDFPGIPKYPKGAADDMFWMLPINPYIAIYRKEQFVWGYSPSYSEMTQKLAHYEMNVQLEAPFDVPNGTYIERDQASSNFVVRGTASITEAGWVTDVWVNGVQLENLYESGIVTRNPLNGTFDLEIPVKMRIGGNHVDITIFAGPEPSCEECRNNGGCAFVNRNYFLQFSKGNFTASSIRLSATEGSSLVSPIDLNTTDVSFHISVTDKDKANSGSLSVLVINRRKADTLLVSLKEGAEKGTFTSETPVKAVSKDPSATGAHEIAFFGADTIVVRYVDEEDEEDISEASFFAKQTYPVPIQALALDPGCTGKATQLQVTFSSSFSTGDRMDSVWVNIRDPHTAMGDSFFVFVEPAQIANKSVVLLDLPDRIGIPKTTGPVGSIATYIKPQGVAQSSIEYTQIKDGIMPFMIGFSLLENQEPKVPEDTMMVGFSEAVNVTTTEFPFLLFDADGNSISTAGLTMVGKATTSNDGKSYLYAVTGNSGELKQGNFVSIKPTAVITDNALNSLDAEGCNSRVQIIEVPKPVPVKIAQMKDYDGDAYPDTLLLQFERKLRSKDMLDSFVVNWGIPQQIVSYQKDKWISNHSFITAERVVAVDSVTTKTVIDTQSVIKIPILSGDFDPAISTAGYANGYGEVIPRLGPEGGFFDVAYPVTDVVGPRIVEARKSGDSLAVLFSEPLDTIPEGLYFLQKKRSTPIELTASFNGRVNDSKWIFFFRDSETEVDRIITVGDLVRISTVNPKVQDKQGNLPGSDNPWVEVKGSLKNQIDLQLAMTSNLSKYSKEQVRNAYKNESISSKDHFRVTFVRPRTSKELEVARGKGNAKFNAGGALTDSADWAHVGPTFDVEIGIPLSRVMKAGTYVWAYELAYEVQVFDVLGQYVNAIGVRFTLTDEIRQNYIDSDGNLNVRIEWLMHDGLAPQTNTGRKVANGAFIGAHKLAVRAEYLFDEKPEKDEKTGKEVQPEFKQGQVIKTELEETIRFGFMRPY
jgi:hypothetical protein